MITSCTASNPSFALLPWMPLILLIKLVDHCFKHPRKKRLALFSLRCFSAFVVLRFCCYEFRCILSLGWSSCHSHELTVTRGLRSQLGCSLLRRILFLNPFDWCWLDWDRFRLRCAFFSSMLKALPMECRNPHGKWRAQMHVISYNRSSNWSFPVCFYRNYKCILLASRSLQERFYKTLQVQFRHSFPAIATVLQLFARTHVPKGCGVGMLW